MHDVCAHVFFVCVCLCVIVCVCVPALVCLSVRVRMCARMHPNEQAGWRAGMQACTDAHA